MTSDFDGSSGDREWCDHWKQCIWFVPSPAMSVSKDEVLNVNAVHDEISISYNLKARSQSKDMLGLTHRNSLITLSPERVGMYGDSEWRSFMFKAVRNLLEGRLDPLCVVADDSVFLTLVVAHLSKMLDIVSYFPRLRGKGLQTNGFFMDCVRVLKSNETLSSLNALYPKKIELLIGEPFYCGTEGKLPWQNLRFWRDRTTLSSALSEKAIVMPCKGILKACAMSLPDVWNSQCSLDRIQGFDHSVVNTALGACGKLPAPQDGPCRPYSVWQCGEHKKRRVDRLNLWRLGCAMGLCYGLTGLWIPIIPCLCLYRSR